MLGSFGPLLQGAALLASPPPIEGTASQTFATVTQAATATATSSFFTTDRIGLESGLRRGLSSPWVSVQEE